MAKNRSIQFSIGVLSILFSGFLLYQIGFVDGLFWPTFAIFPLDTPR